MRVIGVVDLRGGLAVHARGGVRGQYAPVDAVAGSRIERGDPLALTRAYIDRLGLTELYAADLDAILERPPQDTVIAALAALGAPLWVDAGVSTVDRARRLLALGVHRVIVGLETLPSYAALRAICDASGGGRVAFSLDLRDGEPVVARGGIAPGDPPDRLAARAADAGAGTIIVLDLARVGAGVGLDLDTIATIRRAVPHLTLLAGGGVRGSGDLERLAGAGCDGALVATALHTGLIGAEDIAAAAQLRSQVTSHKSQISKPT
ncbi:MAG: HisA/HisF-related TIM barrel protein [Vicinamibacterales bacterium]